MAAIPHSLKIAVTCGIGLFIALIGLKNGGIIIGNPATLVSAGDFTAPSTALCLGGILLTLILIARRVPGAMVLSIATITILGLFIPSGGGKITQLPASFWSLPHSPAPVFLKLTFNFLTNGPAFVTALPLILTLLLVDMFDNIGTLLAVTKRAGLLAADGTLPRAGRALLADSLATITSALGGLRPWSATSNQRPASKPVGGPGSPRSPRRDSFSPRYFSRPHPDGARRGHRTRAGDRGHFHDAIGR